VLKFTSGLGLFTLNIRLGKFYGKTRRKRTIFLSNSRRRSKKLRDRIDEDWPREGPISRVGKCHGSFSLLTIDHSAGNLIRIVNICWGLMRQEKDEL
jgi:hypothetical protein